MIRVYNTLSKQKETLQPLEEGKVGIYLCGPTVYDKSHIGHMVGPIIFDTIKRYLSYSGYDVTWVVNITDVDDKLIMKSRERGIPMEAIAEEMTADLPLQMLASPSQTNITSIISAQHGRAYSAYSAIQNMSSTMGEPR